MSSVRGCGLPCSSKLRNSGRRPFTSVVAPHSGTLIVRVVQNDQGVSLPPDLVGGAPKLAPRGLSGELITLIDMDHYIEGNFEPDVGWVVARMYEMHDHIVETFHEHVVTEDAVTVWKQ